MEISLQDIAGGALQEKANQAFAKVMQNMQDPNTPWKNKRKINICLSFEQNEDRTDCTCEIAVDTKLAAVKPVNTKFCTEKDLDTGRIFAQEYGPGIKGQMSFEDMNQNSDSQTAYVNGQAVDVETGEIKDDSIVDFRAAKQA
ncbi:hypothetical protein D7V86_03870 [bacterium D16-51]|nr:hypothetical protein D7V96_00050 [bacterium D16-59]RKI61936.1 hypothetical protein D7V86_03870 [bacterium D16-51]